MSAPTMPSQLRKNLARCLLATVTMSACLSARADGCLADTSAAVDGELGYRARSGRCEGLLKLFVDNSDRIELLGYHYGNIALPPRGEGLQVRAIGGGTAAPVSLRAIRVGARNWYQMDVAGAALESVIAWPADVIERIAKMRGDATIDLARLALLVCSNACRDQPDTTYWPVGAAGTQAGAPPPALSLLLRSGVRATGVTLTLVDAHGRKHSLVPPPLGLTPDGVALVLVPPDLAPGAYGLTVTGVDFLTREQLATLHLKLIIPGPHR